MNPRRAHTAAVTTTSRILATTDPVAKADLRTSLCDLRAASALSRGVETRHIHPATGLDYSPESYRRALASGADPAHLDRLWAEAGHAAPARLTAVSLFAGIGGVDLALHRAGVDVAAAVEIDDAARGVLAHHMPDTTLYPDVREVTGDDLRAAGFDPEHGILTAGWPCQGNSVAGRRGGMADPRSGLWRHVVRLLDETRPRWFLGENVPGLLSLNNGADFGGVLSDLDDMGYGLAWRVLDAQWFGVPQRRRRVFIVGHLGDPAGPAQILLEPESGSRDTQAGQEAGARAASGATVSTLNAGSDGRGWRIGADEAAAGHLIATALTAREGKGPDSDATTTLVSHALTAEGHDASEDGTGRGTPLVPTSLAVAGDYSTGEDVAQTVRGANGQPGTVAVPVALRGRDQGAEVETGQDGDPAFALRTPAGGSSHPMVATTAVRRLTPLECTRLQGFPDDWLDGAGLSDSAKYRLLGNAVAVPCAEWIARRLAAQHEEVT